MELQKKSRALIDWTEEELKAALRTEAENVQYSYNGIVAEIERRSQDKHTQAIQRLTKWAVILTAVASIGTLVSAAAAVIALLK
ncbi:MAG TPA: hypothetical protein VF131_28715 [Blastocatellia bacterium]|nr:hypothetical protein [Blastocatellia bacterium]